MRRSIILGGFSSLLNVAVNIITSVIISGLAVRNMSSYDAGIWFVFFSIGSFMVYCDLGLSPALSREVGFAYKKTDISLRVSNLFATINRTIFYIALILSVTVLTFAGVMHYLFFWLPPYVFLLPIK